MYRLHGRDANFLYQETPTAPMHTLKIYLMDIPAGESLNPEGIIRRTEAMLNVLPMLRQRPLYVPFGLHHPVMINDPDFDLEYHVCRAALPAPGGMRELEAMVAQIASHPLDQHRPLWELWLVDGLKDGRIAVIQKIHHALADGMASVAYITRLWNQEALEDSQQSPPFVPDEIPSRRRLIWDALVDHAKHDARNLPSFVKTFYHSVRGMMAHTKEHASPTMVGISGDLPRCRWNYALSPKRSFATTQLSLAAVKELKEKAGGTINDIFLGLCATSLRNYLSGHGELPDKPLVASIPVSTDEQGSMREFGNRTAAITTLLHVNLADPEQRYAAIRESTAQGKAELDVMGRSTYGLMMHYTPPLLLQWLSQNKYRKRKANSPKYLPPSNMSISNVPGPKEALSATDNVVSDLYSIGPLIDGMGLNITVWSYAGKLNVSVMGCKKSMPDIHRIADGIGAAMDEWQASTSSAIPA